MNGILNHPIMALALRVTAAGLSFLFGVVAARLLGVEDFGVVSVLLGFVNVGVIFSLLGHETLATREVAIAYGKAETHRFSDDRVGSYRRTSARQVWLAALLILTIEIVLLSYLPVGRNAGLYYLPILGLIPLIARTRLSQGIIRGAYKASLALVPDGIIRPGLSVGVLGLCILLGYGATQLLAAVMLASGIIALLIGLRWERLSTALPNQPSHSPSPASAGPSFSLPIYVSSMLAVLVSQTALISVGLLSDSVHAGLYAAAERFAVAASLVSQAIYLAMASRFASLYASGSTTDLRALIRRVTRHVSVAAILICLLIALGAEPLLGLYGEGFKEAQTVLLILLASTLFNACAGPTGQILLMTRHEQDHLRAISVSLMVQFLLVLLLVPRIGALGAAWSVLCSTIVWNGLMMYFIRRRLSFNPILALA